MVRRSKAHGGGEPVTAPSRQRIFGQPENALTRSPEAGGAGSALSLLERPLTARSLIASLLLGRHPPTAPAAMLVRWCALFGVSGTSARVALTRMVQRGELESFGASYELTGRIRERQVEQDLSLDPTVAAWEGGWLLAIVRAGARGADARVALRRELERARMVPVREGVWARPDNLPDAMVRRSAECVWWRGQTLDKADVRQLVDAYGLGRYERRTSGLLPRLLAATEHLPATDGLADAFLVGAAAAQHLRRDPLLPPELLADGWHADALRTAYRTYQRAFSDAVAAWASL